MQNSAKLNSIFKNVDSTQFLILHKSFLVKIKNDSNIYNIPCSKAIKS